VKVDVSDGATRATTTYDVVRAQVPHMVTLLMYRSQFQLTPDKREYFVYAPSDMVSSVKLAFQLWRRWEKPARDTNLALDLNFDYPKVEDAAVSEPIDDKFYQEMWRSIRMRKHRAAGHPEDPFAFTCLDPSVTVFRAENFQKDLIVTA
jgi:hypothetical protein